ncbi:hypothetical protein GCM10025772_13720 [Ferrimonas gelatinilytica]|uniref:Uncharacterized protein n=1 Tax=Ferrimonas gelatinilytica TaxID=1255257 RepID=A0ABP9S3C8_9GAMM
MVNLYKHHIKYGHPFENEPFKHELVKVQIGNSHRSMQATSVYGVTTTDLRLKLDKDLTYEYERQLFALTRYKWSMLNQLLTVDKQVLHKNGDSVTTVPLVEEMSLLFRLMRFSGLRREEAITFLVCHNNPPWGTPRRSIA